MKAWAEKKRREMEAIGARELAEMFQTIGTLYELEEQLGLSRDSERGRGMVSLTPKTSAYGNPHDLMHGEPAP